jgi:hypothetical protein
VVVRVTVQWALFGKEPRDLGDRILAQSIGPLDERDFHSVLARYALGTPETLPEVAISWLAAAGGDDYVGMAIYDQAGYRDARGREVTQVRYFCVPFRELAAGAVSYQAMFEGFRNITFEPGDTSPIEVELASRRREELPGALPIGAAALLLTDQQVAVVGAEAADLGERLRFLDEVASLLPYGMRSQLSCATWVHSSFDRPKFRLYFTAAVHDEFGGYLVDWRSDDIPVTGNQLADDYVQWLLADLPGRLDQLARLTAPVTFSALDVQQLLAADVRGYRGRQLPRYERSRQQLAAAMQRLTALTALVGGRTARIAYNLEDEVQHALYGRAADNDAAQQDRDPTVDRALQSIRARDEGTERLAALASRASRLTEEIEDEIRARYDASLRDLDIARDRLAAVQALAAEGEFGSDLIQSTEQLGAAIDEAIRASSRLRERIDRPKWDVAALSADLREPSDLAARATALAHRAVAELSRFTVALSYPKRLGAGFPSHFLVQIFPPRRRKAAAAKVKHVFPEDDPAQVATEAPFRLNMKVRITLSSPVVDFSAAVLKRITSDGSDTTFTGTPKQAAPPGSHAAVLAVSDEHGEEEFLSLPFTVTIANYAFDHISRPRAARAIGSIVSVMSVVVFAAVLITRTAQVLGAAAGATGLAFSAILFARINSLYRNQAISMQGDAQLPPDDQHS